MTVRTHVVIFIVIQMINVYLLLCDDPPTCFGPAVHSGRSLQRNKFIINVVENVHI